MAVLLLSGTVCRRRGEGSFTLVEMLVVLAVAGILIGGSLTAIQSAMAGANLTSAGTLLVGQLTLARQEAVTRNEQVEVWFYQMPRGTTNQWCAVQVWRIDQVEGSPVTNAVTRLTSLPDGVILSTDATMSPLLSNPVLSGTAMRPGREGIPYRGFSFRPNGSADSDLLPENGILTLQNASGGANPKNYVTIRINPVGGKITLFRP